MYLKRRVLSSLTCCFFLSCQNIKKNHRNRFFQTKCQAKTSAYADQVYDVKLDTGRSGGRYNNTDYPPTDDKREDNRYDNPASATNGARRGKTEGENQDVFSLNNAIDHRITVYWQERIVCNGEGADFVVFSNVPPPKDYYQPHIVLVSQNGKDFVRFPYKIEGGKNKEPPFYAGFAGLSLPKYHEDDPEQGGVDPFDLQHAGGDPFDLDDLPDTELGRKIKREGFQYLQLESAKDLIGRNVSQYNAPQAHGDVDGIYARYFQTSI